MTLTLTIDQHDILTVRLQEGREHAAVSVRPSLAGATSLARALDAAMTHGYGECFWPGMPGGQHWWIFKRDDDTLETIAMWTRGGASLWEHVFRATDAASWVHDRLMDEIRRLGLTTRS